MAEDEGMFIGGRGGNPRTVVKSTSTLGNRFHRWISKGDWRKPVVGDRYRAPPLHSVPCVEGESLLVPLTPRSVRHPRDSFAM